MSDESFQVPDIGGKAERKAKTTVDRSVWSSGVPNGSSRKVSRRATVEPTEDVSKGQKRVRASSRTAPEPEHAEVPALRSSDAVASRASGRRRPASSLAVKESNRKASKNGSLDASSPLKEIVSSGQDALMRTQPNSPQLASPLLTGSAKRPSKRPREDSSAASSCVIS